MLGWDILTGKNRQELPAMQGGATSFLEPTQVRRHAVDLCTKKHLLGLLSVCLGQLFGRFGDYLTLVYGEFGVCLGRVPGSLNR